MVFILDQSGSVGRRNHETAKEFIINVTRYFDIELSRTRVGLVAFSTQSHIEFNLKTHTSEAALAAAIEAVNYRRGWTATALALNDSRLLLDPTTDNGARPVNEGIPKIAVLLTDGRSNQYPITDAANALKDVGVQVFTVGIGNIDIDELRFISSDPDEDHVFVLAGFNNAADFVSFLSVVTCQGK